MTRPSAAPGPSPATIRILVIGGGIGGLTTAIALRRHGFDAQVYEAAPKIRPLGKGIWVPPNALQALAGIGLDRAVTQGGVALSRIEIRDRTTGTLTALDLSKLRQATPYPTISIHRATLHQILLEHVEPDTVHLGKRCTGVRQESRRVIAEFADGSQAEGDALVGADGIHSAVRQAIFPAFDLRYSGQTCYRGIAKLDLPPELETVCWETWGGACRFGFSSIAPRQVYWFAPMIATAASNGPRETWLPRLVDRYASFPPPIPSIIEHTPVDEIVATDLYDFPPLARPVSGRVILLGDAAHAMTPNLGQGGAQAIEDAVTLAESLAREASIEAAFRRHERLRLPRVRSIASMAWRLGQIAHWRHPWLQGLRNAILRGTPAWVTHRQMKWLYGA